MRLLLGRDVGSEDCDPPRRATLPHQVPATPSQAATCLLSVVRPADDTGINPLRQELDAIIRRGEESSHRFKVRAGDPDRSKVSARSQRSRALQMDEVVARLKAERLALELPTKTRDAVSSRAIPAGIKRSGR